MKFVLFLALLFAPAVCAAELTLGQYERAVGDSRETARIYVRGLGDGMCVTNSALEYMGQRSLFCLPADYKTDYYKTLDLALESGVFNADDKAKPLSYVLLEVYRIVYSCDKTSKKTKKK